MVKRTYFSALFLLLIGTWASVLAAQDTANNHLVEPGDTWAALAVRFNIEESTLRAVNPHINRHWPPAIGSTVSIPGSAEGQMGKLVRTLDGNLFATAVRQRISPWQLALQNNLISPHHPITYQPLFIAGGTDPPKDLPLGIETLAVSQLTAQPGQAVGVRGIIQEGTAVTVRLGSKTMGSFTHERHFLALTGTGAFFGSQQPALAIRIDGRPLWIQPWQFHDPNLWDYQQITLTGAAAEIDQESIRQERERLFTIWEQTSPLPHWATPFQLPITDFLDISSAFGARRSYNGGPYQSYHEGVDFSAYGGTAVFAPAAGVVVVAEQLYVRGGAVIIDHGLGVYTGFYHMSEVLVSSGDFVQPGQQIGAVGTSGLSTGNHLHWDLLVNDVWVDAEAWLEQNIACWVLEGMGKRCLVSSE